jgi:hypothetical protein
MENWWPALCCGVWGLAPFIAFSIGYQAGKGKIKLPFKIRIEKTEEYAVDVE